MNFKNYFSEVSCTRRLIQEKIGKHLIITVIAFLTICFGSASTFAAPVSQKKAEKIARDFFSRQEGMRSASQIKLSLVSAPGLDASQKTALRNESSSYPIYYIYNKEDEKGFVIVSGDDVLPKVLGYSTESQFSTKDMPENLKGFIDAFNSAVSTIIKTDGKNYTKRSLRSSSEVAPLLGGIKWNQSHPWNAKTPTVGGQHTPVGCVATATSQVLRYYKWPDKSEGKNSYYDEKQRTYRNVDLNVTYDWDNMPEAFDDPKSATDKQVEALSTLCSNVGLAENMGYSTQASGAFMQFVIKALRNNFKYDKGIRLLFRNNLTHEEWQRTCRKELDERRPILYAGYGSGGGHAFVCDGYDKEGFYHINWGWGGMSNGYFELDVLNPDALGIGGGSGGGFNEGQQIIVGIKPDKNGTSAIGPTMIECYGLDCSGTSTFRVSFQTSMQEVPEFRTELRLAMQNTEKADDIHYTSYTINRTYKLFESKKYDSFTITRYGYTPNARYKLYGEALGEDSKYHPFIQVPGYNDVLYFTTDNDGKIISFESPTSYRPKLSYIENSCKLNLHSYEKSDISLIIQNSGNLEIREKLDIKFYDSKTKKEVFSTNQFVAFPVGDKFVSDLHFDRLPIKDGSTVDIKIAGPNIGLAETTIAQNILVESPSEVREGYMIKLGADYLDEAGKYYFNQDQFDINGFVLSNVGTKHTDKPLLILPFLYALDYRGNVIDYLQIGLMRLENWDGKPLPLSIKADEKYKNKVKNFLRTYGNYRTCILDLRLGDVNANRFVNALDTDTPVISLTRRLSGNVKVTIKQGEHGSLVKDDANVNLEDLPRNSVVRFTANPDEGYVLDKLLFNGEDVAPRTELLFSESATVEPVFIKKGFRVYTETYGHGTISIEGYTAEQLRNVPQGTTLKVVVKPENANYVLEGVYVNGKKLDDSMSFTVEGRTVVVAKFKFPESMDNVASDSVIVYPNPATDHIFVEGLEHDTEIKLFNMQGQLVKVQKTTDSTPTLVELDNLPAATYILKAGTFTTKIIKK